MAAYSTRHHYSSRCSPSFRTQPDTLYLPGSSSYYWTCSVHKRSHELLRLVYLSPLAGSHLQGRSLVMAAQQSQQRMIEPWSCFCMILANELQLLVQSFYHCHMHRTTHKYPHEYLHPYRDCKRCECSIFDLRPGSERSIIPISVPGPAISATPHTMLRPDSHTTTQVSLAMSTQD